MNRLFSMCVLVMSTTLACGSDDGGGGSGGSNATGGTSSLGGGGGASGSGGSSSGGSAGSGGNNCAEAESVTKAAAAAAGCLDNSAEVKAGCEAIFAGGTCLNEWNALATCAFALPASSWTCNSSNKPNPTGCETQKATFDTCTGK